MNGYLQLLIWTMLFVVLIEMFFPSNDLKKYLKLVLGFIVVYTIISPVIKVVTEVRDKDTFESYVMYYQEQLGTKPAYSEFEAEQSRQQESLRDVYEKQITEQVELMLEKTFPITVCNVRIEMSDDNMDFSVKEVDLVIQTKETKGEAVSVPRIKIGEKDESFTLNDQHVKDEIKKYLKEVYNWDKDNIYITVQH
ncbi:MAG: stage III sporulation protein AF [Cellulosilyticaceae bacterium]